jgi:peptidoglycan LD-endopeptidase LytH
VTGGCTRGHLGCGRRVPAPHRVGRLVVGLLLLVSAGCASPPSGQARADGAPAPPAADRRSAGGGEPDSAARSGVQTRARHVFPVRGRTSYSRFHHDYPATDIFADCRTPVVAPVRGVVLEVGRRDRWRPARDDPATRGGRFVSLRGVDHVRYYGSHLRAVATRVHAGRRVRAGARLGRVGQSGNARGVGCHLHFGISPVCAGTGDWWIRRGTVSPYRFLQAWRRHRNLSPARAVQGWRAEHGCRRRSR